MEKATNQGDRLIERILSQAKADVDAAQKRAQEGCRGVWDGCRRRVDQQAAEAAAVRDAAVQGVLDGARTRAELEGRKQALAMRRQLLDEAFCQATAALHRLSGPQRAQLLGYLLETETAPGDEIVPAGPDRAVLQEQIAALNRPLTLSPQDAPLEGGFLIIGGSYEKDCSLAALMNQIRQEEEGNVARILFTP